MAESRFHEWLPTGEIAFAAMLAAISASRRSIRLEMYIFADSPIGRRFRDALVVAARRGVTVQVLIDGLGSQPLRSDFWNPLTEAGGVFRCFNPLELRRLSTRNHRKLLVCDGEAAFVGGFNIAPEYERDGVQRGWRDLGMRLCGPIVGALAQSFDELFERAREVPKRFPRLHKTFHPPPISPQPGCELLLGVPGRGRSAIQASLLRSLSRAREVRLVAPYFLPGVRLRRAIQRVARRGGRVQLIVPGKTDVALSRLAARSLYQRMLRAGVEIYEYQPQVLHTKLFRIDEAVYVGSSNLDTRSLHLNYELLVRLEAPSVLAEAGTHFDDMLRHSERIEAGGWKSSRSFVTRLRERWAWFLLARVDPWLARWLSQP